MNIDGPFINLRGQVHPCYTTFRQYAYCENSRFSPKAECFQEYKDVMECMNGKKRKEAVFLLDQKIYEKKVLSIPVYDPKTDSFVREKK